MRLGTLSLVAALAATVACSSPARECDTQFDCFGGETCASGSCVAVIEVSSGDGGTSDATANVAVRDGGMDAGASNSQTQTDAGCVPQCAGAQCGEDPVCGSSCGDCMSNQTCEEGACVAARVVTEWRLDGNVVHQSTSAEAVYTAAYDNMFVGIPHNGRTIQLNLADVSTTGSLSYSCADEPITFSPLSLLTSDNGWAELDALPDRWKSLILNGSHCVNPGDDTLSTWSLDVTTLTSTRVVGEVSIEITGGGPRAGEMLSIESQFDIDATAQ